MIILQCNSELMWFEKNSVDKAVACYTGARSVFCVSQGNLDLLRLQVGEPLPQGELVWNPYNVSSERIAPWPTENDLLRMACVARLDPAAKGQDLLLKVMARQEWRERPIEVNFFGEGPYDLALRRLASLLQIKNVRFRGHVNDINAIWNEHHILALPSRYEGLPLALVESMWCGRPAVVTDVAGNAELCVDGVTGFVASSASLSSFAEAMERAWAARTEWKRIGDAARARVETLVPEDPVGVFSDRLQACAAEHIGSVPLSKAAQDR
ncbi:glycosyltransferase family 4 protein [Telmatobacter sp. DSM 110680]|uniref:Glycosyltransferase family 4 protein n=1 Tax=Telmatobacter sp. DSM 110680 TaxID=3036704 RepID=A0AAU7DD89_9BACT